MANLNTENKLHILSANCPRDECNFEFEMQSIGMREGISIAFFCIYFVVALWDEGESAVATMCRLNELHFISSLSIFQQDDGLKILNSNLCSHVRIEFDTFDDVSQLPCACIDMCRRVIPSQNANHMRVRWLTSRQTGETTKRKRSNEILARRISKLILFCVSVCLCVNWEFVSTGNSKNVIFSVFGTH